jgi:hypothetical protein
LTPSGGEPGDNQCGVEEFETPEGVCPGGKIIYTTADLDSDGNVIDGTIRESERDTFSIPIADSRNFASFSFRVVCPDGGQQYTDPILCGLPEPDFQPIELTYPEQTITISVAGRGVSSSAGGDSFERCNIGLGSTDDEFTSSVTVAASTGLSITGGGSAEIGKGCGTPPDCAVSDTHTGVFTLADGSTVTQNLGIAVSACVGSFISGRAVSASWIAGISGSVSGQLYSPPREMPLAFTDFDSGNFFEPDP